MPLSLKNRYDVHSADHVGRVVYFSLDLSMYLFLVKMDQVYLFLVIPQKYIQVMTHVVWKYLDLSMYLFLVKMDQVYLFLVIPQKYIQVMTHVVWKYRKFNIVQSTKSNQNTPPISN